MKKLLLVIVCIIGLHANEDQIERDLTYMKSQIIQCLDKDLLKGYAILANIVRYKAGNDYWTTAIQMFFDYVDTNCPNEANAISSISSRYNNEQSTVMSMFILSHALMSAGEMMYDEGKLISDAGLEAARSMVRSRRR